MKFTVRHRHMMSLFGQRRFLDVHRQVQLNLDRSSFIHEVKSFVIVNHHPTFIHEVKSFVSVNHHPTFIHDDRLKGLTVSHICEELWAPRASSVCSDGGHGSRTLGICSLSSYCKLTSAPSCKKVILRDIFFHGYFNPVAHSLKGLGFKGLERDCSSNPWEHGLQKNVLWLLIRVSGDVGFGNAGELCLPGKPSAIMALWAAGWTCHCCC